jgi:magnesium transporter
MGRLVGRITIDIIDVIRDEADKDYQLAAGISKDVEADDSILELSSTFTLVSFSTLGGFITVGAGLFEGAMAEHGNLFFSLL